VTISLIRKIADGIPKDADTLGMMASTFSCWYVNDMVEEEF
jgi:hypothetical protein